MAANSVPLTADTFTPHLDARFRVEGGHHVLSLSEVERIEVPAGHGAVVQPFVLVFSGAPGDVLAEGMHTITHENGTAFDLYLIPVHTPQSGRQDYQAVFN
jgi:hypothetical protein